MTLPPSCEALSSYRSMPPSSGEHKSSRRETRNVSSKRTGRCTPCKCAVQNTAKPPPPYNNQPGVVRAVRHQGPPRAQRHARSQAPRPATTPNTEHAHAHVTNHPAGDTRCKGGDGWYARRYDVILYPTWSLFISLGRPASTLTPSTLHVDVAVPFLEVA